jgi:hypothetical protein
MTVGRIPSVEGGIQPTLLTTKGDIIVATGNATLVRQGVGSDGTVLTANSAQADGVEWGGAWTTWSPSYGGLTIGNGTVTARYQQIGKTVNFFWYLVTGSTTSISSDPFFTLPVASSTPNYNFVGRVFNGTWYDLRGIVAGNSNCYLYASSTGSTYGVLIPATGSIPITIASTNSYQLAGTYEVA